MMLRRTTRWRIKIQGLIVMEKENMLILSLSFLCMSLGRDFGFVAFREDCIRRQLYPNFCSLRACLEGFLYNILRC